MGMEYLSTIKSFWETNSFFSFVSPSQVIVILVGLLAIVVVSVFFFYFTKLLLSLKKLQKPLVSLEVKPLRRTEQEAYTTEQLFNVIHTIGKQRKLLDRFFDIPNRFAFEIRATKQDGIRYLITCNPVHASILKKHLLSYLPGVSVKRIKQDFSSNSTSTQVTELGLSRHFVYPLKKHDELNTLDPIAYITGAMTKLNKDESVTYQLGITPLSTHKSKEAKRISRLIYKKKDIVENIETKSLLSQLSMRFISLVLQLLMLPLGLIVFITSNGKEGPLLNFGFHQSTNKTINPYQQELESLIKNKLDQPLFTASIRVMVQSDSGKVASKRRQTVLSALQSMTHTSYQSLVPKLRLRLKLIQSLKYWLFTHKIVKPFSETILSASEISDLYHFPFTKTTKTEDLVKDFKKVLPAPLSLKRATDLDIIFANNHYGGTKTPIGLTEDERRRHMYILGATGTGKSTMLLSMIKQDIEHNKGLCVIDPHGDLIENILPMIPKERIKDVVYFNPDDIAYPMGINVLERTPNLSEEEALKEREFITESIISLFHKIYSDKYSGPRMEYILRNTIHTAFTLENPTLFTIYKLLINPKFRKSVTKNLTDEHLKDFWKYEFSQAGNYQKVKMISPITNKIGRFLFSPSAKRILEQEKSTINFDEIMDEGKILLCNVSKGKIGEDNSEVFGVVIMAKIQLAALKRARRKEKDRRDFYLYVDEFQNFATEAFGQILSEARKYRLNAILAHQTTSQLESRDLVNVTLANTGTAICFRTANPEDEKLILPQFAPYIERGDIASLPSYHFYMRLGALNPEEPFSGKTINLQMKDDKSKVNHVIESSRKMFAKKHIQNKSKLHQVIVKNRTKPSVSESLP